MSREKPRHLLLKLAGIFGAGCFLFALAAGNTACPFRTLTGVVCPGCGMSRAWLAALHGHFAEAFRYHPMFWMIPLLAVLVIWDGKLFQREWLNRLLCIGLAALAIGCWIIRVILCLCGRLAI